MDGQQATRVMHISIMNVQGSAARRQNISAPVNCGRKSVIRSPHGT
jgi:hypothetical protein